MTNNTINVLNVKNANDLPSFNPVEGSWFVNGSSEDRDYNKVVEAITDHLAASFPIKVELFHSNGCAITSELPSEGSFLATRK